MKNITITSKGQMTLPKKQRELLGLTVGSQMTSTIKDGKIILTPQKEEDNNLQKRFNEMFDIVPKAPKDKVNNKGQVVIDKHDKDMVNCVENG